MVRIRATRVIAVIAVVACAPADTAPPVDTAADLAAIVAVREAEAAAIGAGDVSGAYLSADARLMPPGEPAVTGHDAIRSWMTAFMTQFSASVNYASADVTVSGDWAFETYAATLTLTPTGGGESMSEALKGIHIYRREADGTWKMVYDVWNTDTPPPAQEM